MGVVRMHVCFTLRNFSPILCLVVELALAAMAQHTFAQTNWQNNGTGDWFTSGNWSAGVPHLGIDAFVGIGGTAVVGGIEPGATIAAQNLTIGFSSSDFFQPPGGPGTLDVTDLTNVNVTAASDLFIGHVFGGGGGATGTLNITGTNPGDVHVGDDVLVGYYDAGTSNFGQAKGIANLGGNLTTTGALSLLTIGQSETNRPAIGNVTVSENIIGFQLVRVGYATGAGAATGDLGISGNLTSHSNTSFFRSLSVAETTNSAGSATGDVVVLGNVLNYDAVSVGKSAHDGDATGTVTIAGATGLTGTTRGDLEVGINRFRSGTGTGTLNFFGNNSITGFDDVIVGRTESLTDSTGSAVGILRGDPTLFGTLAGTDDGDLLVGSSDATAQATGTVENVTTVSGFNHIVVGQATDNGPAAVDAMGTLNVGVGGLTGAGVSELRVGHSEGTGNAVGHTTVNGNVTGFIDALIGVTTAGGTANGTVTITGGILDVIDDLEVGVSHGTGADNATGTLTTDSDVHVFDDLLTAVNVTSPNVAVSANATVSIGGALVANTAESSLLRVGLNLGGGSVDGDMTVANGISGVRVIEVGVATAIGTAQGDLMVTSGGMTGNTALASPSRLDIGVSTHSGHALLSTATITGNIFNFDNISIGKATSSGNATGTLSQVGDLTGTNEGDLNIGTSHHTGHSEGTLDVSGQVNQFREVQLGVAHSSGEATGKINVSGDLEGFDSGDLLIGVSQDAGNATVQGIDNPDETTNGTASLGSIASFTNVSLGVAESSGQATIGVAVQNSLTGIDDGSTDLIDSNLLIGVSQGSGRVRSTVVVGGPGISQFDQVVVGMATDDGPDKLDARGELRINSGGLTGTGQGPLRVGVAEGAGSATGIANAVGDGDVSGFVDPVTNRSVEIGFVPSGMSGQATGSVTIFGNLIGDPTSIDHLTVGESRGTATANGTLDVRINVQDFDNVNVGVAELGQATGFLAVGTALVGTDPQESLGISSDLFIGVSQGDGIANGRINATDVSDFDDVWVGVAQLTGAATGNLSIDYMLDGLDSNSVNNVDLQIGVSHLTGTADGTLTAAMGIAGAELITVGQAKLDDGTEQLDAIGELTVLAGGLPGSNFDGLAGANHRVLIVGESLGSGSANGTAEITGDVIRFGDGLAAHGGVTVGHAQGSGDATGTLDITDGDLGGIAGPFVGDLFIGEADGSGAAIGTVAVTGEVFGFSRVKIGNTQGSGDATGTLITGGGLDATHASGGISLDIGVSSGSGNATGVLVGAANTDGSPDLTAHISFVDSFDDVSVGVASSSGNATGTLLSSGVLGGNKDTAGDIQIGVSTGSGQAWGKVTAGDIGESEFFAVTVGLATDDGPADVDASGELLVDGGHLIRIHKYNSTGFPLTIGRTNGAGTATGKTRAASVIGFQDLVQVGYVDTGATGDATGELIITDGNLDSRSDGVVPDLDIGVRLGIGSANGTVEVAGAVIDYQNVEVGVTKFSAASGSATGRLIVGNNLTGFTRFERLPILSIGEGDHANGHVEVLGSVIDFRLVNVGTRDGTGTLISPDLLSGTEAGILQIGTSGGTGVVAGATNDDGSPDQTVGISSVQGFHRVSVGVTHSTDANGFLRVSGSLTAANDESNPFASQLEIGVSRGTGRARATVHAGGLTGVSQFDHVTVGLATDDGTDPLDARGGLAVTSVGITGTGQGALRVGVTEGAGTASGIVNATGDIVGFTDPVAPAAAVEVGVVASGATGEAIGLLTTTGDLTGDPAKTINLSVGKNHSSAGGTANGTLQAGGKVDGFTSVQVGTGDSAIGVLTTGSGIDSPDNGVLQIGVSMTASKANGSVDVNGTMGVHGFTTVIVGVGDGSMVDSENRSIGELKIEAGGLTTPESGALTIGAGADGTVSVRGGIEGYSVVRVGQTGNATGSLLVSSDGIMGDSKIGNQFEVGTQRESNGLAKGVVRTFGVGDVGGFGQVSIGTTESSGGADGTAEIFGTLTGTGTGSLVIGRSGKFLSNGDVIGATGQATGYVSTMFDDIAGFDQVAVGMATADGAASVEAMGVLEAVNVIAAGDASLMIGLTTDSGVAEGQVSAIGTTGVQGFDSIQVGGAGLGAGHATGDLTLTGGGGIVNTTSNFASIFIGHNSGTGSATGTVSVTDGVIENYDQVFVGLESGGGEATGTLELINSVMTGVDLIVGEVGSSDAGISIGTVTMNPSLINLSGQLKLGPGSVLVMTLNGTTRADGTGGPGQYSAINAASAQLGGLLELRFGEGFVPDYGQMLPFVTANTIDGTFNQINGVLLDGGDMAMAPVYDFQNNIGLNFIAALPGDANLDGTVNNEDLDLFYSNAGSEGDWLSANFNGDRLVDLHDLDFILRNLGRTVSLATPSAAQSLVPEPATLTMLVLGTMICLRRRQR